MKKNIKTTAMLLSMLGVISYHAQLNTTYYANGVPILLGARNCAFGKNSLSGSLLSGNENVAVGWESMITNAGGEKNVAVGYQSLYWPAYTNSCVAVGYQSMFSPNFANGAENTAIGYQAHHQAGGNRNNAHGFQALYSTASGDDNIGTGYQALYNLSGGHRNVAYGTQSLYNTTGGIANVGVGYQTLFNNNGGVHNVGIGNRAMHSNTGGADNIGIGMEAAFSNQNGAQNTALGAFSFWSNITGGNNVAIGSWAGFSGNTTNFDNNCLIGIRCGYNLNTANAVMMGYEAGYSAAGSGGATENTFVGYKSGRSSLISGIGSNSFFGHESGKNSTTGDFNCFFGDRAGFNNGAGSENTFSGFESGMNGVFSKNTYYGDHAGFTSLGNENLFAGYRSGEAGIGNNNVALGSMAMYQATAGNENTIIGYRANWQSSGTDFNTMVGSQAGLNNGSGKQNSYFGYKAGSVHMTGQDNTYVGYMSGTGVQQGSDNTFVGSNTSGGTTNLTNASAIGAGATVMNNNEMIVGNNNVKVGIGLSGITPGPQTQLEINTPATSAVPGASGLRFRDLTSASTQAPLLPGNGLLSVNAAGDVIYVQAPVSNGGGGIGNYCINPVNALTGNYEIPTNNNNFYFRDDNSASDKVNVGIPCGQIDEGKFNVETVVQSDPGNNASTSVWAKNWNSVSNAASTGVYGAAISLQNGAINTDDRGISGYAEGEGRSVGVYGESGIARPGKAGTWGSYGGYFRSVISGGDNFGIYAEAANGTNNWAGFFQGDINVMGSGYANYTWVFSDRRFKRDITPLKSVNEKIAKLNGYTYGYRTDEFNDRNFDNNKHIGFIAQELKEVFPELVTEKAGYYAVDYQGMVPVLLEAIKEQQAQMNAQQKQIDELKAGQTTAMRITPPSIPVSLSDNNSIVLNQNVPNPFAESTTITYNITSDFGKAQIIFSTDEGKVIKTVDITAKGPGSLTVFADDLSHGIYTYTLVVDGKTISSYKMIKE